MPFREDDDERFFPRETEGGVAFFASLSLELGEDLTSKDLDGLFEAGPMLPAIAFGFDTE